jgi:hypothetical protein
MSSRQADASVKTQSQAAVGIPSPSAPTDRLFLLLQRFQSVGATDAPLDAAKGCDANKEIAARFSTTEDTVKSHVKYILLKLGAKDRTHARQISVNG